jgi:hypothetical protein
MDQVCQFRGLPGAPANIFVNGTIYCWNRQTNHSYWLKEEDYTCKDFDEGNCPCPELKADTDIAGIGVRKGPRQQSETSLIILAICDKKLTRERLQVILAFFISAGLTVLTITILEILTKGGEPAEQDEAGPGQTRGRRRNRTDEAIYNRFGRSVVSALQNRGWDVDVLAACAGDLAQSLNDTQLVTGAAILVAALVGLHREDSAGPMTVYHFTIATDLAWLSAGSHIASLHTETHQHGSRSGAKTRPRYGLTIRLSLWLRIILILAMGALLAYATWVGGYTCWYDTFDCPAKCTTSYERGGEPKKSMIVSLCFICIVYPMELFQLLEAAGYFRFGGFNIFNNTPPRIDSKRSLAQNAYIVLHWALFSIWDFLSSDCFGTLQFTFWFMWGCFLLIGDRILGHREMSAEQAAGEDRTGFGQLVPLVLLLLPLMALMDSYAHHSREKTGEEPGQCSCGESACCPRDSQDSLQP